MVYECDFLIECELLDEVELYLMKWEQFETYEAFFVNQHCFKLVVTDFFTARRFCEKFGHKHEREERVAWRQIDRKCRHCGVAKTHKDIYLGMVLDGTKYEIRCRNCKKRLGFLYCHYIANLFGGI